VMMMTPDQVRVIAAREAIGRFGMPYGPDAVAFAAAKGGVVVDDDGPPPPGFDEVVLEEEERSGGSGHAVRDGSASTVRVHSPLGYSILEPSTDGISSLPSPPTPTSIPLSEFGEIEQPSKLLLSPNNDRVLRSGSVTSNYSAQTYATAAESLSSVPLTTGSNTDSSRSSSYCAVPGGGDVVNGWSSSDEEGEERS